MNRVPDGAAQQPNPALKSIVAPKPVPDPGYIPTRNRPAGAAASMRSIRVEAADGAETTLHVARFRAEEVRVRVAVLEPAAPLLGWCVERGIADAMIGGFFLRPQGTPLGELWIEGESCHHIPFEAPWGRVRACVGIAGGRVTLAARADHDDAPEGDLLQAGPLLLSAGRVLVRAGHDPEGFSAGAAQFDSDITDGRYPRAALGCAGDELIAAVCDGRGEHDHGLTLEEIATAMADLGAVDAINLDGGGSASLVIGGELRNHPREDHGIDLDGGRAISTALVFAPLGAGEPERAVMDGR